MTRGKLRPTFGLVAALAVGCVSVPDYPVGDLDPAAHDAGAGGAVGTIGAACGTPSALACAGHAQKLALVCDPGSGKWTALQSCSGQQLCDTRVGATQGSCQEPAPPCLGKAPGDKVCQTGASVECGPDLLTTSTTACPFACAAGACVGSCTPGTRRCTGATPEVCDAKGSWKGEAPCAYVCTGSGQCTGECTPDAKECADNAPRSCDANGTWQTSAACAGVCAAGVCVAACTDGAKQCNALVPQRCVGGGWQSDAACPYVCKLGACSGACSPGAVRCSALVPQTCDANGAWQSGTACADATPNCSYGTCVGVVTTPPSCIGGASGQADCGPTSNESCCTSLPVPGGTVQLDSTHTATVSDYKLDKYEITVGRFRKFVDAVVGGWTPTAGAGKHTHLNGGSGLSNGSGGYEPGWDVAWNTNLPTAKATWDGSTGLACDSNYQTWTNAAGANEKRPINCTNWYQTAAFCIWDGGFLPSEAEWQYAAAGGSEGRHYPWGATAPGANAVLAVYGCFWAGTGSCTGVANIAPVGSLDSGRGKWGHSDLAGNVLEWTLDGYVDPYASTHSTDYAGVAPAAYPVFRGGAFNAPGSALLTSQRYSNPRASRDAVVGARCARSIP